MTPPKKQHSNAQISRPQARQDSLTLIHLFSLTKPNGEKIRFTADSDTPIAFGGGVYAVLPVDVSGFAWNDNGTPVRPTLSIANKAGLFDAQLEAADLVGRQVIRIATFIEECDPPLGRGGGACFTPECWKIDRLARLDSERAVFDLIAEADLAGKSLPSRVMLRDLCQHRYRVWDARLRRFDYRNATCPYVGGDSFDADGTPTEDAKDHCSLELESGCKKRFKAVLPFLGFPGINGS